MVRAGHTIVRSTARAAYCITSRSLVEAMLDKAATQKHTVYNTSMLKSTKSSLLMLRSFFFPVLIKWYLREGTNSPRSRDALRPP